MKAAAKTETISIPEPKFEVLKCRIEDAGVPYVQLKFAEKAKQKIRADQEAGDKKKAKKAREAKDFEADYQAALHVSTEGWYGIPAPAFRNAMIDACRVAGVTMTRAKLLVFIDPDGVDATEGTPLVRLYGTPKMRIDTCRNATGVIDLRARATFDTWYAFVKVRFDSSFIDRDSVVNLLTRAGMQVGVGEGRPYGKQGNGLGWGLFNITEVEHA